MPTYSVIDVLTEGNKQSGMTKDEADKVAEALGGSANGYVVEEDKQKFDGELFTGLQ